MSSHSASSPKFLDEGCAIHAPITSHHVKYVNGALGDVTENGTAGVIPPMARPKPSSDFKREVGIRLRQFVASLEVSEADVSRKLKIGQNKLSQWISGRNLPDITEMVRLHNKYGLSLDWLYTDDRSHISAKLLKRLEDEPTAKIEHTARLRPAAPLERAPGPRAK